MPAVRCRGHAPPTAACLSLHAQEIFDDGEAKLWDVCDIVAHFPLEVGAPRGRGGGVSRP
mgnify:CR=1 FL=1